MQFGQFLRRLVWRVRRRLRPVADHDPVVSVEAPARVTSNPPRRRNRWTGMATGFAATFSILAAGYAVLVALSSQTPLDPMHSVVVDAGGSRAISASVELLDRVSRPAPDAEIIPLLPNGRKLRGAKIAEGMRESAVAFVRMASEASFSREQAIDDALASLAGQNDDAARDALAQFNLKIAEDRAGASWRTSLAPAVAAAVADACEAQARALRAAAVANEGGMVDPAMQGEFSRSRGVAYGWLMILRGALADAPEIAERTVLEAAIPLDALAGAAEHQPLFLFNGNDRAPWAPAHIETQISAFARAAAGARALSIAASKPVADPI